MEVQMTETRTLSYDTECPQTLKAQGVIPLVLKELSSVHAG